MAPELIKLTAQIRRRTGVLLAPRAQVVHRYFVLTSPLYDPKESFVRFSVLGSSPLLLAWLAGCGSTTEPKANESAIYILQRVAGDALPAILANNEVGNIRVFADTILLAGDGTGSSSTTTEFIPTAPGIPDDGPESFSSHLHYRLGLDRLEISFDCPPGADCVGGPHLVGELRKDGLELHWGPQMSGREPMEYVRIR
jgi:hypothetical protein